MKTLQKLILPILIISAALLIYYFYFAAKGNLGSFADFDPNNTASKDIIVQVVHDRGIQMEAGGSVFYGMDKNGDIVLIQAPPDLPQGINQAERVKLRGHLHKEYFHAHEVYLE